MPRIPRQKSESGIYHMMLRGINQQVIFEDDEDYTKFINTLETYKAVSGYKVFAYCLMSNHIHILIKVEKEDIDLIMKRIAGSYVYWYNWKYYRKGHLFQDRFKSEPVENDEYFLTVLRYIHQNPIKAGIVEKIDEYEYSSYNEYVIGESSLLDMEFVYSILSKEKFEEFNKEITEDVCLDVEELNFRLSDNDAMKIVKEVSKCENATEFQTLDPNNRDKYIRRLKKRGLSYRQISRLTGISFAIVRKA
ncbi:MAG: transposase [Clostridia bacterium]|nr:transposase [Clostridia bacterium]